MSILRHAAEYIYIYYFVRPTTNAHDLETEFPAHLGMNIKKLTSQHLNNQYTPFLSVKIRPTNGQWLLVTSRLSIAQVSFHSAKVTLVSAPHMDAAQVPLVPKMWNAWWFQSLV